MNTSRIGLMVLVGLCVSGVLFAHSAPTVTNVTASQRTDGSGIVDIAYTLNDPDGDKCTVSVVVSNDGGSTFTITPTSGALSGALKDHDKGCVDSTAQRLPVELVYYEACLEAKDAYRREKYLKSGTGKKYLRNRLAAYWSKTPTG